MCDINQRGKPELKKKLEEDLNRRKAQFLVLRIKYHNVEGWKN